MTREEKVSGLIDEALVYERMDSRISDIIVKLTSERANHVKECKETGDTPDKSYDALLKIMDDTRNSIRDRSNELWAEVDKTAEKHESGYEALAQAVLELAARDYESALCGCYGSESQKYLIEKFARNGAEIYTKLDFYKVLKRIESAYPKFVKTVKEHGDEIIEETRRIREKKNGKMRYAKIRCPNCGCGLYASGSEISGLQMIRCVGCNFQEYYRVKRHVG